jgi:rhodanese-related sulfurtransferase
MKSVMMAAAFAAALGLSMAAAPQAMACGGHENQAEVGKISVDELAARIEKKDSVHIYDANSKERFEQGHVPGATWVDHKDISTVTLPKDTSAMLVFYCAREQCKASTTVAQAAVALGYTNVYVMPEGIKGWEAKSKPTERPGAPREEARRDS